MLIYYFSYSSILRIYQQKKKLKSHNIIELLRSKFLDKCKKGCKKVTKSFRRSTTKICWMNTIIASFDPIYTRLTLCQISWSDGWFNDFNIFWERQELFQWVFALLILQDVRFLTGMLSILLVSADFWL